MIQELLLQKIGDIGLQDSRDEKEIENQDQKELADAKHKVKENLHKPNWIRSVVFPQEKKESPAPTKSTNCKGSIFNKFSLTKKRKKKKKKDSKSSKDYYLYETALANSVANGTQDTTDSNSIWSESICTQETGAIPKRTNSTNLNNNEIKESSPPPSNQNELLKGESQSLHDELLYGSEMELADWETDTVEDPQKIFKKCSCLQEKALKVYSNNFLGWEFDENGYETLSANLIEHNAENESDSRDSNYFKRLKFPRILSSASFSSGSTSLMPSRQVSADVHLTHHATNHNPPKFSQSRSSTSQVTLRRERSVEAHLQRMNSKVKAKSPPSNESLNSSLTKLPPLYNRPTSLKEITTHSEHLKCLDNKNDRPPTPCFVCMPISTPSSSFVKGMLPFPKRNSLPELAHNSELRDALYRLKQQEESRRHSLANEAIIIEENEKDIEETTIMKKVKNNKTTEFYKLSYKCNQNDSECKVNDTCLKTNLKDISENNQTLEDLEQIEKITLSKHSESSIGFQAFVNKLSGSLWIQAYNDIVSIYEKFLSKKRRKGEINQMIFDHDVSFWANTLVEKILEENFTYKIKETPRTIPKYTKNLCNKNPAVDFSDVVSLREEYFAPWITNEDNNSKHKDLVKFALSKMSNQKSSRPNSATSILSLLI